MLEDDYAPATRSLLPSWILLIALVALAAFLYRRWLQPDPEPTRLERVRGAGIGAVNAVKDRLPSS